MTIWDFQRVLSRRLLIINIVNIFIGSRIAKRGNFLYGVGSQAIGWGLINVGIAIFGAIGAERRKAKLDDPYNPEIMNKDSRNLRNILLINTGLDILYMLGGRSIAQRNEGKDDLTRGMGWGIVIQGALLFLFDLVHVFQVPNHKKQSD